MSRADIHQFGWPNSELIMPISRVNRPQSRGWFDYSDIFDTAPSTVEFYLFLLSDSANRQSDDKTKQVDPAANPTERCDLRSYHLWYIQVAKYRKAYR